jgi:hypothetical protein
MPHNKYLRSKTLRAMFADCCVRRSTKFSHTRINFARIIKKAKDGSGGPFKKENNL